MATIETKLRPFTVPNYVLQDRDGDHPKFPLHELTTDTLAEMCDEFRIAVFAKAMKKDPKGAEHGR